MFAVVLSLINEQSPDVFNVGIKCEYLSLMNQVNILSPVRISIVVAHGFYALAQRRFFLFLRHYVTVLVFLNLFGVAIVSIDCFGN